MPAKMPESVVGGWDNGKNEADLRNELSTCLTSHWKYCIAGVLGGFPVGVALARASGNKFLASGTLMTAGMVGTFFDWKAAERDCAPLQANLDAFVLKQSKQQQQQQQQRMQNSQHASE